MHRTKRHIGALNKYDSEWTDGIFLVVSGLGVSVLVGTSGGIIETSDNRRSPDWRWNKDLVLGVATTFEEHICPAATPAPFVIEAGEHGPGIAPEVAEEVVTLEGYVSSQEISWRVVLPEVVLDAFSYNEEAECLVIIMKPVGHTWRVN